VSGGVGIWRIGRGIDRALAIGSVTPGMEGIRGGSDNWGSGFGSAIGVATTATAKREARVRSVAIDIGSLWSIGPQIKDNGIKSYEAVGRV
jgi:hypothetical protein